MAKQPKPYVNNELDKSLHCCNKFYHIFVNELVFIFFFFLRTKTTLT